MFRSSSAVTSDPSSSPPSKARCASFLRRNPVVPSYSWSRLRIYQAVCAHTTPLPHHLLHNPATAKRLGFASTVHFIAASHPHYGTDSKVTSREPMPNRTTAGPPQSGAPRAADSRFLAMHKHVNMPMSPYHGSGNSVLTCKQHLLFLPIILSWCTMQAKEKVPTATWQPKDLLTVMLFRERPHLCS